MRCIMIFYGITARLSYQTMQIGFFRMAPRRSTSAGRDKASTTNKRNCKEFVIQHKNSFVQFAIDMQKTLKPLRLQGFSWWRLAGSNR